MIAINTATFMLVAFVFSMGAMLFADKRHSASKKFIFFMILMAPTGFTVSMAIELNANHYYLEKHKHQVNKLLKRVPKRIR